MVINAKGILDVHLVGMVTIDEDILENNKGPYFDDYFYSNNVHFGNTMVRIRHMDNVQGTEDEVRQVIEAISVLEVDNKDHS